ncbi:NTP/NDP exchange transporter [Edaphobacter aggregans]|uniref:NTP/NDP exchange transporter n=1 Tax=Edaphobacter aggregans TaxID=570835 RepID=UPI000690DD95|nr:Npt1/Npt2 family nucleotide transporter [Edaphobacter aggregans]
MLLTTNLAILLGSYYLLKPVREALILTEGGAEVKSYSSAAQAVLLLLVVPAYGAFGSRVRRLKLIASVTFFFVSNLIVFYFLGKAGVREGVIFFIWVGIFNYFVIAQFWAFANDLFSESQGKRLFPILGIGSSLGALVGAWAASRLINFVGPYGLILAAAGGITTCIALTALADRWGAQRTGEQESTKSKIPLGKEGGFELIWKDRYLLLIAVLTVLLNVVNTSGEFILSKLVVARSLELFGPGAEMARKTFVGSFYAQFFGWVNLLGLVLQTLFVSRIFRYVGVRGSLFILPTIAFTGYTMILLYPALGVVRLLKILENSTDYSVQNTARQALFLPTSREAKYKAKVAVDTFFVRIGDVLQAGIVYVGTMLAFSISTFAAISVALTLAWILVSVGIYREHKQRIPTVS